MLGAIIALLDFYAINAKRAVEAILFEKQKSLSILKFGYFHNENPRWPPKSKMAAKKTKKIQTSITPSCSGPIPAQKSRGNSVLGVVFSYTMPKMVFHYSHRFS